MKEVSVILTARELTLVRVACLTRLDKLKDVKDSQSYQETRELMIGKLWAAVRQVSDDIR